MPFFLLLINIKDILIINKLSSFKYYSSYFFFIILSFRFLSFLYFFFFKLRRDLDARKAANGGKDAALWLGFVRKGARDESIFIADW